MILDLFAGPGGWDTGLRDHLGLTDVVGLEWDAAACQTRAAAGHRTIRCDVAQYPKTPFVGKVEGLIASPPCQEFSRANTNRKGLDSERGSLVSEALQWVWRLNPDWIAFEQVPDVLPIWQSFRRELRGYYVTWAGILNAADYGVPQARQRAFLLARHSANWIGPPEPTHAEEPHPDLFGRTAKPWVTMADALGWGMTDRPSYTVTGGGARTGGAEPFAAGARAGMQQRMGLPSWVFKRPATTVVGSFCPDVIAAPGYRTKVSRQNAPGSVKTTVAERGVLQSFPADYPWQGANGKQSEQVGNAVPPLLAAHVVSAVAGVPFVSEVAA